MTELVHDCIFLSARRSPQAEALAYGRQRLSYAELGEQVALAGGGLLACGLGKAERVAVYLEKRIEAVAAMFGASWAGGVFVPVNPLLKPEQVAYIANDCNVRILVTSPERYKTLAPQLAHCPDLRCVILTGAINGLEAPVGVRLASWETLASPAPDTPQRHGAIDADMAAILYTSGSTGKPKGVVLSHRNIVAGAHSVAGYLHNQPSDRILSVLPLSFDYGFSQLTTAFHVGATVVLMNYLFPRDIVKAVVDERITGLAAVPPLWMQLVQQEWPEAARLRYLTNSGGAMPGATLDALRKLFPDALVFLMYGLTEAFRSSYLPPSELDRRPDSIGRAIPNAELMVVRQDGSRCRPGETGELVHRGALVSMGYWNDPGKTAERFRPAPSRDPALPLQEIAVWSGDLVRTDEDGFLYFVGRNDDMIKVSGYRISPTEVEEVLHATGLAAEVAALGVPHPQWGQAVVAVALPKEGAGLDADAMLAACKLHLPAYMVPAHIEVAGAALPRNPNGKIDRKALQATLSHLFESA
jgi:acyl-CoA ligase (AMP-forming) (exosortase A-associated)